MAVNVLKVKKGDRSLRRKFIRFPHSLYQDCPYWVPFFNLEMRSFLTRTHPYFQNYPGEFFVATRDSEVVGTIEVSYNHNYIEMHKINTAHFFFMDFIDDREVVDALIARATDWALEQGATYLSGPLLSGGPMGSGILVEGYTYPATMTMMRYNYHYYHTQLKRAGFKKMFDLYSYYVEPEGFKFNPRVARLAELVKKRGHFQVVSFHNKRALTAMAKRMVYDFFNVLLGDHPENYPLESNELTRLLKDLKIVARPDLIRFITYKGEMAGYVLGFPDITHQMQRARGAITPLALVRLLRAAQRTKRFSLNGVGIMPQYQRLGGNALLYAEMAQATERMQPDFVELTQIGEQTDTMVSEASFLVDKRIKVHRVMQKKIC